MIVRQHTPSFDVAIYPNRGLKPYDPDLVRGDLLAITTHKALGEISGAWSLTFDYRVGVDGKTWADRVAPMDYVVIALSRSAGARANARERKDPDGATYSASGEHSTKRDVIIGNIGGDSSIVMRGFVDNVREAEVIDPEGHPQRQIVINGRDFGKLLETTQIWYNPTQDMSAMLQGEVQLQIRNGIAAQIYTPGQLFALVLESLVDRRLRRMALGPSPHVPAALHKEIFDSSEFQLNGLGFQQFVGTVQDLLTQIGNAPWCEFFVEDRADGPYVVLRWAPFLDANGGLPLVEWTTIQAKKPVVQVIDRADVASISVGKSDNEVYSYYFTFCSNALYDTASAIAATSGTAPGGKWSSGVPLPFPNPYVDAPKVEKYGVRVLDISTRWVPIRRDPTQPQQNQIATAIQLCCAMNKWLVDVFGHNESLRNGEIVIKGRPSIRIGQYLLINDYQNGDEYFYVEAVDHSFTLYSGFTTTLQVARGQRIPGSGAFSRAAAPDQAPARFNERSRV